MRMEKVLFLWSVSVSCYLCIPFNEAKCIQSLKLSSEEKNQCSADWICWKPNCVCTQACILEGDLQHCYLSPHTEEVENFSFSGQVLKDMLHIFLIHKNILKDTGVHKNERARSLFLIGLLAFTMFSHLEMCKIMKNLPLCSCVFTFGIDRNHSGISFWLVQRWNRLCWKPK